MSACWTVINEIRTLAKHISCECKCRFHGRKCNSGQWWNDDKCWCESKKHHLCEKVCVWNPAIGDCETLKYLACIMDDFAIMYEKVWESYDEDADDNDKGFSYDETKTILTNFNEKKAPYKTQNFCILLAFLLIIVVLLILASIYCYLIKYQAKHLLPFHYANNELREVLC